MAADLIDQLERAVELHLRGRPEEAIDIGQTLLGRSRGTPHAAAVHRHQADFLLAAGHYESARQMATEAGSLARASRHPGEIVAATLAVLACDAALGHVAAVHQQVVDLLELAPLQPLPVAFLARLMLLVGQFEQAIEQSERARSLLDTSQTPAGHPMLELTRAELFLIEARAALLAGQSDEALARCERVMAQDLPSQVPGTQALAFSGLALARKDRAAEARQRIAQAVASGRKISQDLHGQCLAVAGLTHLDLAEPELATEQLRVACALMRHPLDRQEVHFALGRIARELEQRSEAEGAFRRATEPTTETHFGRLAVQALHELIGLRAI